jgi:hypothetical protein
MILIAIHVLYTFALGVVTRRIVRLIRPPSFSSVEVPAMILSMPWKHNLDSPSISNARRLHRAPNVEDHNARGLKEAALAWAKVLAMMVSAEARVRVMYFSILN